MNIVPPSTWADVLTTHSDTISGIQNGRRGFFYQVVQSAVRAEVEMAETTDSGPGAYPPLGSVLPRNSDDDIFPFLPRIVPGSCNGCDACIRLCPHAAITCEKEEGESGYYLNPDSCTGCGLCVDVCDQGAVKVDRWKCQDQTVVPLASKYCPACGVAYHQPTATINKEGLCRVCAAKGDLRYKLFQVLE
ncbi:MAG: ferredoxin family protein [Gammaproteobacteria bacterium]|nr:ferredoxin family protein [Gammaproteobacteria bacterium]